MITSTSPAIEYDLEMDLVTRFFQVLSDSTRVRIIELLLDREQNVSELVHGLGVPQARVSAISRACAGAAISAPVERASSSTIASLIRACRR